MIGELRKSKMVLSCSLCEGYLIALFDGGARAQSSLAVVEKVSNKKLKELSFS